MKFVNGEPQKNFSRLPLAKVQNKIKFKKIKDFLLTLSQDSTLINALGDDNYVPLQSACDPEVETGGRVAVLPMRGRGPGMGRCLVDTLAGSLEWGRGSGWEGGEDRAGLESGLVASSLQPMDLSGFQQPGLGRGRPLA